MLQVNPCKRIKVSDIKIHPWLRKTVPIYAKIAFFSRNLKDMEFALDEEVLDRVKLFNMESLKSISDVERIRKTIKRRMDDSFVTVYELLKDEKEKDNYCNQFFI
jgi:hypothetical protein